MDILLKISYCGTNFFGSQIQNKNRTIQGEVENFFKLTTVIYSRTDRFVHATEQLIKLINIPISNHKRLIRWFNCFNAKFIDIQILSFLFIDKNVKIHKLISHREYLFKLRWTYKSYECFNVTKISRLNTEQISLIKSRMLDMKKLTDFKHLSKQNSLKDTKRKINNFQLRVYKNGINILISSKAFLRCMVRMCTAYILNQNSIPLEPFGLYLHKIHFSCPMDWNTML